MTSSAFVKLFLLIFATLPIQRPIKAGCVLIVVGELRTSTKFLDDVGQLLELLVQLLGIAALQNAGNRIDLPCGRRPR